MRTLRSGEEVTFEVDARRFWNTSDVQLEAGGRYALEVIRVEEPWQDAWVKSSVSTGWQGSWRWIGRVVRRWARARHLPMYALVGAIDEDAGTFFLIGEATEHRPTRTGRLQAFANDWPGRYSNNKGRCVVAVRRLE
jgi:hypothetical protein